MKEMLLEEMGTRELFSPSLV